MKKIISISLLFLFLVIGCSPIVQVGNLSINTPINVNVGNTTSANSTQGVVNSSGTISIQVNNNGSNVSNVSAVNVSNVSLRYMPIANLTPGSINVNVRQDNINKTICVSGYTDTIRPSTSFTNKIKVKLIKEYGYTDENMSLYELDHFVPLSIGGHPSDQKNLWPELYEGVYGARIKDKLEVRLQHLVCNNTMNLSDAQACIMNDWVECSKKLGVFT